MDFLNLAPFALVAVIFYFLIFRPQAAKQKEHEQMLSTLKNGQNIMLDSGIYGKIVKVNEEDIIVEISDNAKIKVIKKAVLKVI